MTQNGSKKASEQESGRNPFRHLSGQAGGEPPKPELETDVTTQEPEPDEAQVPAVVQSNYLVETLQEACDLTPEQVEGLNSYMVKARLGMSLQIAPLICHDGCPFVTKCPISMNKISLPFGKPCPVEIAVMKQYRDELAVSLGIDANAVASAFDRKLLDDLAFVHMIKMRLGIEMSSTDPEIAKEKVIGYSPQGDRVMGVVLNPRLGVLEKLMKLEKQIMTELMATRRAKFQATGNPDDASQVGATLLGRMEEAMQKKIDAAQTKNEKEIHEIIDADYEVQE